MAWSTAGLAVLACALVASGPVPAGSNPTAIWRAQHRHAPAHTAAAAVPAFTPLPQARQTQHTAGVPHTDKMGRMRMTYKDGVSFLPLVLYHTVIDSPFDGENYSAAEYKDAGFNALHFWPAYPLAKQVAYAKQNGFQALPQIGTSANASAMTEIVKPYAIDESVLGWFLEVRFPALPTLPIYFRNLV